MKKIKIKDTDFIIIILIFSLVVLFCKGVIENIQYQRTDTVIGRVVYVDYPRYMAGYEVTEKEHKNYYIHIVPLGRETEIWDLYTLTSNAKTESEFSLNEADMAELTVGAIVEIEYRVEDSKEYRIEGREIMSIKCVQEPAEIEDDGFEIIPNENYTLGSLTRGFLEIGEIVHMVRLDEMGGYIIYLGGSGGSPLKVYWIEDSIIEAMADDIKAAFENGSFEGEVRVRYYTDYQTNPFVNSDALPINKIEFFTR